jgi:hypothetical protein
MNTTVWRSGRAATYAAACNSAATPDALSSAPGCTAPLRTPR